MSLDNFIHYDSVGEYIVYTSLGKRDTESYSRALCLFELLVLGRGVLRVPGCDISARDCKTAIFTCVMAGVRFGLCLMYVLVYFFYFPDFLCFIFLYFEYDVIINK